MYPHVHVGALALDRCTDRIAVHEAIQDSLGEVDSIWKTARGSAAAAQIARRQGERLGASAHHFGRSLRPSWKLAFEVQNTGGIGERAVACLH
jgi:hypothetical protein